VPTAAPTFLCSPVLMCSFCSANNRCGGCVAGYALSNGQCLPTASPTAAPSSLPPTPAPTTATPSDAPSALPTSAPTDVPTYECDAFLNCAPGGCTDTNVCGACAAGYELIAGGVCIATNAPTPNPSASPTRPPTAAPTTAGPTAVPSYVT
jgi:hypothetical protein